MAEASKTEAPKISKPPLDARLRLKSGVFIATQKLNVGRPDQTVEVRIPGDLVPEAEHWDRAFVDLTGARRLVRLSPDACVEIVREALAADPGLAAELVRLAREGEKRESDPKKKPAPI